jgi:hypothetical protein
VSGWHPDERAHAGTEHLDRAYVADYDAKTGLDVEEALGLLRRHGLRADTTLLDLGCGTGLLAAAAAPEAGRMLKVARRRSDAVEWVEARFLTYEHEGDSPQLVHEEWLAGAAPTPAEGWTRAELETHVRDEHSTFAWLQESLLEHAGFEVVERDVRSGIYATYVSRRP